MKITLVEESPHDALKLVTRRVELEFIGTAAPSSVPEHMKDSVWLGRDRDADIVFGDSGGTVSRRHAEIRRSGNDLTIHDNASSNGTLVNQKKISAPTLLKHNDVIQLGASGPTMRIVITGQPNPPAPDAAYEAKTRIGSQEIISSANIDQSSLVMSVSFGPKGDLSIGRAEGNDIKLDGLQISKFHARLRKDQTSVSVEDLGSTNGVFVNGIKITRKKISASDALQIGAFVVRLSSSGSVDVYDGRTKTRIDAVNITKDVKNRAGGGNIRLLDGVSISIQPNEFVGLLGPSGAGKSTLMDAMNGMRPPSNGVILINNLDFYQHLASLKKSVGYVPQDDIIHRELTVYRTLYYVAKLRLSSDVTDAEIDKLIDEILDETGLTERRDIAINQLSGGQRKRVSIAVELITKPAVIFLDEPTSGLDPGTEEKIMNLFREIAQSGRTIILTTHAMENVRLFDKIVVLMRGKLVFYGSPREALAHFGAASFKDLYDKLEEPIAKRLTAGSSLQRITEDVAEEWKQKFTKTLQYKNNVYDQLVGVRDVVRNERPKKRGLGFSNAIKQWMMLSRRYWEVLSRDKLNLLILFAQAPIIALLTYLVMGENQTRDFAYFILALVAVWFGTAVAAREIIRERPVYSRERMVNVGLVPYVFSKLFILGIIVGLQCLLLFLPLKALDLAGFMGMPGEMFGVPQFLVMLLTAFVGIAIGLLISAQVKTSELATSLVPLILIPQILFSGLIGVPTGINKVVGLMMPATWAFDTMKRLSTLDTLEEEGAKPDSEIGGRGYYKYIEMENDRIIADSKEKIDNYKIEAEEKIDELESDLKAMKNPAKPSLGAPPKPEDAKRINKSEMSNYVSFLNPWMGKSINQVVLMLMLMLFIAATLVALRSQDVD